MHSVQFDCKCYKIPDLSKNVTTFVLWIFSLFFYTYYEIFLHFFGGYCMGVCKTYMRHGEGCVLC